MIVRFGMKNIKDIVLRSQEKQEYTGKKIAADEKTNFVSFVSLVKAVFKNDYEGKNSGRFWDRLKPELEKTEYTNINDDLFISPSAVNKLASQNATACKKTWGVFYDDGLQCLLHDLGGKKRRHATTSSPHPSGPSKTLTSPGAGTSKKDICGLQEGLLNTREKHLNDQEAILASRAALVSERERLSAEKEKQNEKTHAKLMDLHKRLNKKEQEMSAPDMMKFVEQVSSLANKFKEKVSRSRRTSSQDNDHESPTPSCSPVKDKDYRGKDISRTPSCSPSPIPGSNSESPAYDGEVRNDTHPLSLDILMLMCFYFLF